MKFKFIYLRERFRSKYISNSIWMLADNLLRLTLGLIVGGMIARYLGPEIFGIYSFAYAITSIFSSIAKLGLDSICVREIISDEENKKLILGSVFWLKMSASLFSLLALIIISINYDAPLSGSLIVMSLCLIFQCFDVVDFYFQSRVQSRYVTFCKLIQLIISALCKIYLILVGADIYAFCWVLVFDQALLSLSMVFAYRKKAGRLFFNYFDFNFSKKILRESWPLIISNISILIYMRVDQFMIEYFCNSRELGYFSAALKVSEVLYFIPMVICSSLYPWLIDAAKISDNEFLTKSRILFEIMVAISISIALPIWFFSTNIIYMLYGVDFINASQILDIHIWSCIFVFLGVAGTRWLIVKKLTMFTMSRAVTGAIINIILNLMLIPNYGAKGAAIATLTSQFVASVAANLINIETRDCFKLQMLATIQPLKQTFIYLKRIKEDL